MAKRRQVRPKSNKMYLSRSLKDHTSEAERKIRHIIQVLKDHTSDIVPMLKKNLLLMMLHSMSCKTFYSFYSKQQSWLNLS